MLNLLCSLCSIHLPCLCLPLWKRRLGCDRPVLQERHLGAAPASVSTYGRKHNQNSNAGIPDEESWRARTSLFLPGKEATSLIAPSLIDHIDQAEILQLPCNFAILVLRFTHYFILFLSFSDANKSPMLSLITAWAKRRWQGNTVDDHHFFSFATIHNF